MQESSLAPGAIGRGALWGIALVFILTAFAALILTMTQKSAAYLPAATRSVAWASVLLAGAISGRQAGHGGLLNGALGGLCCFVLAIALGTLVFDVHVAPGSAAIRAVIALFVGALGGIVGVVL